MQTVRDVSGLPRMSCRVSWFPTGRLMQPILFITSSRKMYTPDSYAHGVAHSGATREELAAMFRRAGIDSDVGSRVVRLKAGPLMFKFAAAVDSQETSADYEIDADGYGSPPELLEQWCERVSACLLSNGIAHRIVHFAADDHALHEYRA